jgi:hypothetical protein
MTPEDAHQYLERWRMVEERELTELRQMPIETKARQLSALMASQELFGEDPGRKAGVLEIRARWARLRKGTRWLNPFQSLSLRRSPIWRVVANRTVGGVASSFRGRPRLTQHVDALAILPESQWEAHRDKDLQDHRNFCLHRHPTLQRSDAPTSGRLVFEALARGVCGESCLVVLSKNEVPYMQNRCCGSNNGTVRRVSESHA